MEPTINSIDSLLFAFGAIVAFVGLIKWAGSKTDGRFLTGTGLMLMTLFAFRLWPRILPLPAQLASILAMIVLYRSLISGDRRARSKENQPPLGRAALLGVAAGFFALDMAAATLCAALWGYPVAFFGLFFLLFVLTLASSPLRKLVVQKELRRLGNR